MLSTDIGSMLSCTRPMVSVSMAHIVFVALPQFVLRGAPPFATTSSLGCPTPCYTTAMIGDSAHFE